MGEKERKDEEQAKIKSTKISHEFAESLRIQKIDPKDLKLGDLEIHEGDTYSLTYHRQDLRPHYKVLKPDDIEDVKKWLGIPDEIARKKGSRCCKPVVSHFFSDEKNVSKEDREGWQGKKSQAIRTVAKEYVYGDSAMYAAWRGEINNLLKVSEAFIYAVFYRDIIIHNGATLNIANNTTLLTANRVKMYGTGKIVSQGPLTLRCYSLEGNL